MVAPSNLFIKEILDKTHSKLWIKGKQQFWCANTEKK